MKSLSLLIKPASGACNMRCRYCFYADVAANRDVRNYGMMTEETLENIVEKALNEAEENCTFGFQGGEPTLAGLDFFRRFIELEEKYNRNNVAVSHTLQTNGLLLDDEWAAFLARHKFLTGVSIDAGKQLHDAMRPDASGRDTHNRAVAATRVLAKHGAEFNILTVVTRALASHPDKTYRYYKERGFRHIQFIPCLDSLEEPAIDNPHSLPPDIYGRFLNRIFDLWYADFMAGEYVSIRAFDNYIHMLAGHPPENCAMSGQCRAYLLIEADGSVFPCDFYALDAYRLGNINTDAVAAMLTGDKAASFAHESEQKPTECLTCHYYPLCRGGCRRDRESIDDNIPHRNRYCQSYKTFFSHALPRMQNLARRLFA